MGRFFPAAALLALALFAWAGSPSGQDARAPKPEVEDLGKAVAGDVWTSGPRGGTYADATEISGRTEVARFLT